MLPPKITFHQYVKVLFSRLLGRRVHLSQKYLGRTISMEDGQKFQVIRNLIVDPKENLEKSMAIFKVRFKFSSLPLSVNKRLSMFPAPFLMAMPGFREKIWTISEDGYFQGIYQWISKESAELYPLSIIFRMMTKRSEEGTLAFEIIPDTVISQYIEERIL